MVFLLFFIPFACKHTQIIVVLIKPTLVPLLSPFPTFLSFEYLSYIHDENFYWEAV